MVQLWWVGLVGPLLVMQRIWGAEGQEQGEGKDWVAVVESTDVGTEHRSCSFGLVEGKELGDQMLLM
jgi:hypothetical protein